jgi:energy-coupling factor transporter ATP-binding protein EcfA2
MFLKRLVYVNWGNVPDGDFEFGPVNLFSGANGSGKTTAADAIQTVMTAAHENLFHYNPGQDESTQRGRGGKRVRTLASYVLGCDDGSYARTQGSDGYLAAVFHPTGGETAEPFTAIVAVRAWLDQAGNHALAREDQTVFFVLPTVQLSAEDLQRGDDKERKWILLDEAQGAFVSRFGKRAVERYDQKRSYLRRLYGALRGKNESVSEREALAAARAFSRFMAYKPVNSIHQFVADEVLERKDLGDAIRSVSAQLKTIHGMERDAQSLKDSALLLEQAGNASQNYIEAWTERVTFNYIESKASYAASQAQYLKTQTERESIERKLKDNDSESLLAEQRREQVHSAVVMVEAQRQGIESLKRKDELEKHSKQLTDKLSSVAVRVLESDKQFQTNALGIRAMQPLLASATLSSDLPQLTDMQMRRLVESARAVENVSDMDWPRLLQRDLTNDLAMLEQHLDNIRAAQSAHNELHAYWKSSSHEAIRRDQLADFRERRKLRYEQITAQFTQKQAEIERLQAKQTVYPAYVERALTAIRAQLPHADARVLCDHIEIADERWQAAIEGYVGGARFNILVSAEYEADAIRIVKSLPSRDRGARVVQGEKALKDAARSKPPSESIVGVLKFTHKIAEAFFIAHFGNVVRVNTVEDLRHTPRGVTVDGFGSGSYTMFRCEMGEADLVFGVAARERALRARRIELEELTTQRQEMNDRLQECMRLLEAVDRLAPLHLAEAIGEMLSIHRDRRATDLLLEQLDTREHAGIDAKLAELRKQERELLDRIKELNTDGGKLSEKLTNIAHKITALSAEKDAAQDKMSAAEESLREAHGMWPEFDLEARLRFADSEAQSFNAELAATSRDEIDNRLAKNERTLDAAIQQHNQKSRESDKILYMAYAGAYDVALFRAICEIRREIDRVYNILKNNVLVEKHSAIRDIKASFNNAFVSNVCQEIYQAILDGKRQIDLLNKELVNHRFGSDREQFRFASEWMPEYREYWRFFEEVVKNPLGEGATLFDVSLSAKSTAVRDALMDLLLGADEAKSIKELERIADYRNYQRYEIYKEVEGKDPIALSEYGTGSGGQLETPAYIIRAASITSSLRYSEGVNHLRMVLVDEAFSKMDETRSREVINYLTQSLGLQLIFIMPTSKCGPFMDLISNEFVFAKVPSALRGQLHTRVLVDRRECNQERIQELWAQHRRTVAQQAELDFMADVE